MKIEITIGPQLNQVAGLDETLQLGWASDIGEVVDPCCPLLAIQGGCRSSQTLSVAVLGDKKSEAHQEGDKGGDAGWTPTESLKSEDSVCRHGPVGIRCLSGKAPPTQGWMVTGVYE